MLIPDSCHEKENHRDISVIKCCAAIFYPAIQRVWCFVIELFAHSAYNGGTWRSLINRVFYACARLEKGGQDVINYTTALVAWDFENCDDTVPCVILVWSGLHSRTPWTLLIWSRTGPTAHDTENLFYIKMLRNMYLLRQKYFG